MAMAWALVGAFLCWSCLGLSGEERLGGGNQGESWGQGRAAQACSVPAARREGGIEGRESGVGRQANGFGLSCLRIYQCRAFSCFLFCQYILIPGPVLDLLPAKAGLGRGLLPP